MLCSECIIWKPVGDVLYIMHVDFEVARRRHVWMFLAVSLHVVCMHSGVEAAELLDFCDTTTD
jgi:hypothetical protein